MSPPLFILFTLSFLFPSAHPTTFHVTNRCPFTVWAAAIDIGRGLAIAADGGGRLNSGQSWTLEVSPQTMTRIWGRTSCDFDADGKGTCRTGDCGGVLHCEKVGTPPYTIVEHSEVLGMHFFDISLVDGFNIPMSIAGASEGCEKEIRCAADIIGHCPNLLRVPDGCNHPCTVFRGDDEYCAMSGKWNSGPNRYSRVFKDRCPDAISWAYDEDASRIYSCPSGSNYTVLFCPFLLQFDRTILKLIYGVHVFHSKV